MALNPKQQRFVDEYLATLDAPGSYRKAYPNCKSDATARSNASRLLMNADVCAAVTAARQARSERTGVTQDMVLGELALLAFSDMRSFASWGPDGVRLLPSDAMPSDAARCVAEVGETVTKGGGSLRFKLHSKTEALALLGKHLGMFKEKLELTGKDGTPLLPDYDRLRTLAPDELVRLHRETLGLPSAHRNGAAGGG